VPRERPHENNKESGRAGSQQAGGLTTPLNSRLSTPATYSAVGLL